MSTPNKKKTSAKAKITIPKVIVEQQKLQADRFAEIDQRLSVLLERANKLEITLSRINEKNANFVQLTTDVKPSEKKDDEDDANKVEDEVKDEDAYEVEDDVKAEGANEDEDASEGDDAIIDLDAIDAEIDENAINDAIIMLDGIEAEIEGNAIKDEDSLDSDLMTKLAGLNMDAAKDDDEDSDVLAKEIENLNLDQHDD